METLKTKSERANIISLGEKYASEIFTIQRHASDTVFSDLLDLIICMFSFGREEELYHSIRKRYEQKEFQKLGELTGRIINEYYPYIDQNLDFDLLGSIYESLASNYAKQGLGQFFTPTEVTKMMAIMSIGNPNPDEILICNEPSVGSGRNCISVFNLHKNTIFNAIDLDKICVRLAIVNMYLYEMVFSEVLHGNTISGQFYGGYRIDLDYPIVEKMFGGIWNSLSSEQQNHLKEVNSKKTIVIKKVSPEEIQGFESIYFTAVRKSVQINNRNIEKTQDKFDPEKVLNILKSFENQVEQTEPSILIEKSLNDFQQEQKQEIIKVIETPVEEIIKVKPLEKSVTFEFKKTKKFENQMSLFDI